MLRQITGDTYISDVQEGTTSYSKVYNFYLTYAYNDMSAIIAIEIPTLTYIDEKATGIGVETVGTNKGQAYYTTFDRSLGQNVNHVVANFGKNLDIIAFYLLIFSPSHLLSLQLQIQIAMIFRF